MSVFPINLSKAAQRLVIGAALLSSTLAAKCSYPPGINSSDQERLNEMQPCFPSQANSGCCALNKGGNQSSDICLSNGLCLIQVEPWTGLIVQNTCTDSAWGSDCPQISTMGTVMPASSTPSVSVSTTVTATTTVTGDHAGQTTTFSGDGSKTAAIGAGVGVGLGACLLASLGVLIFQRRMYEKRLREMKSLRTPPFPAVPHYASGPNAWPMELHGNHKLRVYEIDSDQRPNA
ncbi:hypothetical protein TCE0_041f13747 [Talaromyces pinophilus]|uniref:Uncharacterized protein n=1 Tax=Talaromyces pinophilus TaxID=128442 RepID=A0A6V8HH45_TALPI|nr:hypothetical protein TCE0_041f13747 [Talaromyces pinophilus]